ncbi:MAG: hypothetical protein LBF32_02645, partial [Streptococcaceae bacterium]|nr:hypothetical protein [Streptococcaceae bacterium]
YLPIGENSWFKLEVEPQSRGNHYIRLKRDWYQKVMKPSKTIVKKRPRVAEDSPILIKEVLQGSKVVHLYIPIEDDEDGFFGSQLVASFI